jgi:hypothetical protein
LCFCSIVSAPPTYIYAMRPKGLAGSHIGAALLFGAVTAYFGFELFNVRTELNATQVVLQELVQQHLALRSKFDDRSAAREPIPLPTPLAPQPPYVAPVHRRSVDMASNGGNAEQIPSVSVTTRAMKQRASRSVDSSSLEGSPNR